MGKKKDRENLGNGCPERQKLPNGWNDNLTFDGVQWRGKFWPIP